MMMQRILVIAAIAAIAALIAAGLQKLLTGDISTAVTGAIGGAVGGATAMSLWRSPDDDDE